MEAHADKTPSVHGHRAPATDVKPLAQYFAIGLGATLTLVGIAGFIVNSDFSTGDSLTADKLIIFDVNGWHNLAHLLTGLFGLYMSREPGLSRIYAGVIGIAYLVLWIVGLLDNSILGAIPVNDPDMILHGAIAVTALACAMAPDLSAEEHLREANSERVGSADDGGIDRA